jgi:hypothetical protein
MFLFALYDSTDRSAMKHSKVKQVDRYETKDVDVDEVELDVDLMNPRKNSKPSGS